MTKLEQEMQDAIFVDYNLNDEFPEAMAAARVAKRYIEKAVIDIMKEDYAMGGQVLNEATMCDLLNVWYKENGL